MERCNMRRTELKFYKFALTSVTKLAVIAVLLAVCLSIRSAAQQPGQRTFSSPEDAGNALFTAIQSNDEKTMLDILGRDGNCLLRRRGRGHGNARSIRTEISAAAPSGKRAGRNNHLVHRRGELAHAYTAGKQRQFVVFRYRRGEERNLVSANWPQRNVGHSRLPGVGRGGKGVLRLATQRVRPENLK